MEPRLNYVGKLILAPMVRIGTLPMRLLALQYGADIVYGEEIIDHRMLMSKRVVNPILNTVDFVLPDGRCIFRTCQSERDRVVFQMGTSDAERALKVAKLVERDVAGIDVNMGCPKDFSLKGGMGAALLKQPAKVKDILTTLVQGVSKPVTCKIRLLPTLEATLELIRVIESSGVEAIGVHGREQHERSTDPCHYEIIKEISRVASIPLIANGGSSDITTYEDIEKIKKVTGCESIMLARAAQWNPSVFRKEGTLPLNDVIKQYLKLAVDTDNNINNTKYAIAQMLQSSVANRDGQALFAAGSMREICAIWDLMPYLEEAELRRKAKIDKLSLQEQKELGVAEFYPSAAKKRKMDVEVTEDGVMELCVRYNRREFDTTRTPKTVLLDYTRRKHMKQASFLTTERRKDRMFKSVVTVGDERYSSSIWGKSKRYAEQSAAVVALTVLGEELPTIIVHT